MQHNILLEDITGTNKLMYTSAALILEMILQDKQHKEQ